MNQFVCANDTLVRVAPAVSRATNRRIRKASAEKRGGETRLENYFISRLPLACKQNYAIWSRVSVLVAAAFISLSLSLFFLFFTNVETSSPLSRNRSIPFHTLLTFPPPFLPFDFSNDLQHTRTRGKVSKFLATISAGFQWLCMYIVRFVTKYHAWFFSFFSFEYFCRV